MPSTFLINPSVLPTIPTRKALLIIDLQNDFVSSSGGLCASEPEGFVTRALELAKAFRDSNAGDVIWVRSEFESHRPLSADGEQILVSDISLRRTPARGRRPASRLHDESIFETDEEAFLSMPEGYEKLECVRKGTTGAEFAPEVQQAIATDRDIVFTKTHYSAFASGQQELVQMLRGRFVTEMYICGALTNVSIYATAIDGGRHGYDMTVVDDCCGYRKELRHLAAVRQLTELTGSEVINAEDVIKTLQPIQAKKTTSKSEATKTSSHTRRDKAKAETVPVRPPGAQEQSTSLSPAISRMTLNQGGTSAAASLLQPQSTPAPLESAVAAENKSKNFSEPHRQGPLSPDTNTPLEAQSDDTADEQPSTDENESAFSRRAKRLQAARLALQASANQDDDEEKAPRTPSSRRSATEQIRMKVQPRRRARPSSPEESKTEIKPGLVEDKPTGEKEPLNTIRDKSANDSNTKTRRTPPVTEQEKPGNITNFSNSQIEPIKMSYQHIPRVSEPLCEGDTSVITNVLSPDLADTAFENLLNEVSWAGMSHLGGEVPRRIAVQGEVDEDGNMPVYRHPADESPPLLPFSPTVLAIKTEVEKHLGHPLNHVLIQHYRNGNDYISEHSDKTLDVVRGGFIANVSLGAERTMIFRTKRPPKDMKDKESEPKSGKRGSPPAESDVKRQVQRAPLPHNSLCRMGLQTNMRWLHSIRQDRRADRDKTPAELSHGGARISLTFRQIGTFLDANNTLIWGQGAKGKTRAEANPVVNGQTPNAVKMLQAFGRENHASEFDWNAMYGCGFDVLHMGTPKRFCAGSSDAIANSRVGIALAELGVACAKGSVEGEARFEDNFPGKTVVEGHDTVLRYLDAVYGAGRRYDQLSGEEVARRFTRLQLALDLLPKWRSAQAEVATKEEKGRVGILTSLMKKEMIEWEKFIEEAAMVETDGAVHGMIYITGGSQPSPADFALWPVLHDMVRECGEDVLQGDYLKGYYREFGKRSAVQKVLSQSTTERRG